MSLARASVSPAHLSRDLLVAMAQLFELAQDLIAVPRLVVGQLRGRTRRRSNEATTRRAGEAGYARELAGRCSGGLSFGQRLPDQSADLRDSVEGHRGDRRPR